jgi:hypothetical protein
MSWLVDLRAERVKGIDSHLGGSASNKCRLLAIAVGVGGSASSESIIVKCEHHEFLLIFGWKHNFLPFDSLPKSSNDDVLH